MPLCACRQNVGASVMFAWIEVCSYDKEAKRNVHVLLSSLDECLHLLRRGPKLSWLDFWPTCRYKDVSLNLLFIWYRVEEGKTLVLAWLYGGAQCVEESLAGKFGGLHERKEFGG